VRKTKRTTTAKSPAQRAAPKLRGSVASGAVAQASVEDYNKAQAALHEDDEEGDMQRAMKEDPGCQGTTYFDLEVERMHASVTEGLGNQGWVWNEVFVSLASHIMSLVFRMSSCILSLVFRMSSMCAPSLQSGCTVVDPWHYVLLLIFELMCVVFVWSV